MWFFMITCYVMTLLSFVLLMITGLQGYLLFRIVQANHALFALLTSIIYLFTETLIIFFFVGIGVSIKEYTAEHKLNNTYHQRSLKIKREVYPPLLLNMLLVMILFISGGALDTHRLAGWAHGLLYWVTMFHFCYVIKIEHESFKKSTAIVLEMSGVK